MRLLFVSHSLPPAERPLANLGGMQRVALELDEALRSEPALEYDAYVLRSSWRAIHFRTPVFLVRAFLNLRRRILRGEVDAVLFSSMVTASLAVPLRRIASRMGIRLAAIVHGLDVTTPFGPYQRFVPRVFASLDLVLPVSRATGNACLERGLRPDRLHPVGNGVDVRRFAKPPVTRKDRREKLALAFPGVPPSPDQGLILVSVGRHVRRKGFEWFVRQVMPALPEDVHYWIAGEGPETTAIVEAVRSTSLGHRVHLIGRVSEAGLHALYAGGDLFVMPNIPISGDMEGFGVVMLEAGLGGMPSIGSRLEGIAEVIRDGLNGQLVTSGDVGQFRDAILRYHGQPDLLSEAGQKAYGHTRDTHGWDAVAKEYCRVLELRH